VTDNLAEQIARAHANNEARIAAEIETPKPHLESNALVCARRFSDWCRSTKGVPFCPAQPATVAAYIRHENKEGANFQRIFETVRAIEQMHDAAGVSNPCASMAVRHVLGTLYHIDAPRSWPKADRPLFNSLPIEVRFVIERRAEQDSLATRRALNEAGELRRKLKAFEQKEIQNGQVCEKVSEQRRG
jgi:hypothetical protein